MKFLKYLGITLVSIVLLFLITAIFVSGDISYEKTVEINADVETVWENVNSLKAMDQWSPWDEKDPAMKKELTGEDGTVGAKQCWESKKEDVGSGCQTITAIDHENYRIETELLFTEPYESEAKGFVNVEPSGDKVVATWGFSSTVPYPWRIFNLFMNMEEMLDEDFSKGMNKLKKIAETE